MTYQEALKYLDSFINYEKKDGYDYNASFSLDRMRRLAASLGNPQDSARSVHVAGSKGKGSTCAITHSILRCAGFKTGLYTSPHLSSFRERIRIDDTLISEDDLTRLMAKIRAAVDAIGDDPPTFFEICTALAYLYFKEKKADIAVYETGLGGRLDATNILKSLVCAITPISYEHTDKLGNTLAEIAGEKAGIIKEGGVCVAAPQEKEALRVIEDACRSKKTRLILIGRDILFEELAGGGSREYFNILGLFGEYPRLETGLLGRHQIVNAATAVGIIEALKNKGLPVPGDAIREGIAGARWEGRLEIVGRNPLVVLDGAQNRASAKALADAVRKRFEYKRMVLVLGVSKDKDMKGIADELTPLADSVILTKSRLPERAAEPSAIKDFITRNNKKADLTSNVAEAVEKAKLSAGEKDLILITGSLFVVGEAREILTRLSRHTRQTGLTWQKGYKG
jgi:dihydrofolate synthase / folylpolyglutamate synthase